MKEQIVDISYRLLEIGADMVEEYCNNTESFCDKNCRECLIVDSLVALAIINDNMSTIEKSKKEAHVNSK